MMNLKDKCFSHTEQLPLVTLLLAYFADDLKSDKNGRLLFFDAKIDDQSFALLNIYNADLEKEELSTLTAIKSMLNTVNNISRKQIILCNELNFYFDSLLKTKG